MKWETTQPLRKQYDVNEESYRCRFRSRTHKKDESYTNLATDLMDLVQKWLSDCKSLNDALEKLGIERPYWKKYAYGTGTQTRYLRRSRELG